MADEDNGFETRENKSGALVELDPHPSASGAWAAPGPTGYMMTGWRNQAYCQSFSEDDQFKYYLCNMAVTISHVTGGKDTTQNMLIHVTKATNLQVQGHMTVYMDGNSGKKKRIKAKKPLTQSTEVVTTAQILNVKDRLGKDWKDLGRRFGFDEGFLEQEYMQHHHDFCELNYQILLKWQRQQGPKATQGTLAKIFKDMQRGDLADLLAD